MSMYCTSVVYLERDCIIPLPDCTEHFGWCRNNAIFGFIQTGVPCEPELRTQATFEPY